MIAKICHPTREDHFLHLSRYLRRDPSDELGSDNFASLSRYMTRDEDFKTVATNNGCERDDIDTTEQVVLATQNLNTRARKKPLHLVVSFAKGERPGEEQLMLIEQAYRDPGYGYTERPYVNPFGLYDQTSTCRIVTRSALV